jgi:type IV secretion system protein VirB9
LWLRVFGGALAVWMCAVVLADAGPQEAGATGDARVRSAAYREDAIYDLRGFVGYQIDLQFERDEHFIGLSAGDMEGLTFAAQDNHLFLKPKAAGVRTNLTVLTNHRIYRLEYTSSLSPADPEAIVYALRFLYPPAPVAAATGPSPEERLESARAGSPRPRNFDYWYCGRTSLQPLSAWDDGVHTYLRFSARAELPALFVREEDGGESLINFTAQDDQIVIHRVARQWVVRRGRLTGCIVNRGYEGAGERLDSGTVTPEVERVTRGSEHVATP